MKSELRAEVRHRSLQVRNFLPCPRILIQHVRLKLLDDLDDRAVKIRVVQTSTQLLGRDLFQDLDGVMQRSLPDQGGELTEDFLRLRVPGPPEIVG